MKKNNPYLAQVLAVLPRLLALYDVDPTSESFGQGDRYRWAWKLIDFGNGTFQGAANGIARLIKHQLLPVEFSEQKMLERIDAIFLGAKSLTRKNGSLEEAMPYESSFCVTALVAYDLLTAVELLQETHWGEEQVKHGLDVVRPMIGFLMMADETHALISNHLATAAVALYKWQALTGEATEVRGKMFLDRILRHQSQEGWFSEYEGADPGYQSLCTYYLADLHRLRPDLGMAEPLAESVNFLSYFAHPDGSFGGSYGSRNTRFYYPSGLELLGGTNSEAEGLACFMRHSITDRTTVRLDVMDEPNLIPMFNSYCWAAVLLDEKLAARATPAAAETVPAIRANVFRREFPEAGLVVDKGLRHYTIVSWFKGGVCYHFDVQGSHIDHGVLASGPVGEFYSTQAYHPDNLVEIDDNKLVVDAPLTKMTKQLPDPFRFLLLRILCLTVMRSTCLGRLVKKMLVRLLITGKKKSEAMNRRVVVFGETCSIKDDWRAGSSKLEKVSSDHPFHAIHMASQGYWQRQDDLL